MAKSLTRMIQETQRKYGCASVSVTHFEPSDHHPKGWWSASVTSVTKPVTECVQVLSFDTPKAALAALCQKLDELLDKQEAPARQAAFQAAAAAWFRGQAVELAKAA